MPRVVRNFWLEADVDGRISTVAGGPRGKDGGITLRIYQRSGGEVKTALRIECHACRDGTLRLDAKPALPHRLDRKAGTLRIETKR
jgi:hypothetical protein